MLKRLSTFLISVLLGFLVWALSPMILGCAEPWDSSYPFYSVALFSGGAFIALGAGRSDLLCGAGVWLGQVVALLTLPGLDRGWWMLGVMTTGLGSLIAVAGHHAVGIALCRCRDKAGRKTAS